MTEFDREIQAAVAKDKRDKIMHRRHELKEAKEKQRYKLLASAPDTAKLCELVAQYFCDKPGRYVIGPSINNVMQLFRDNKTIETYRVVYVKGRFRFERLED